MKVLTNQHPVEKALQHVENILTKHGLTISYQYGLIVTDKDGNIYHIRNTAGMSSSESLPRFSEEDRLVVIDE